MPGRRPRPAVGLDPGLADRPNNKTTQGLFYLAYGMDEMRRGQPWRRHYALPGSAW